MRSNLLLALAAILLGGVAQAEPLVGPGVGNADLLIAEGMRLYNEKAFAKAKDDFLTATRAAPATLPTYLSLARAYFALNELELACQEYRVYVRAAPDTPDRDKAQSELSLCERRLKASRKPAELSKTYVSLKASFFEALDKGTLTGAGSAEEHLKSLLAAAYAAPDLGEMATKLATAAGQAADQVYQAALTRQKKSTPGELRQAAGYYQLALDCGAQAGTQGSRIALLQGLALMVEGQIALAEPLFRDAAAKDPSNREAIFLGGLARYLSGDKSGALESLKKDLPDDPRTAVLELAASFDYGSAAAATELQKLLFARKFESGK